MNKVSLGIILAGFYIIVSGLSGFNSRDNQFFGNWKLTSESVFSFPNKTTTVTFNSDGYWLSIIEYNGSEIRINGTWDLVEHEKLRITSQNRAYSEYLYTFSNNNKNLTLNPFLGGDSITYTKQ